MDCGSKVVALIGVDDLIVVETPDGLLITKRNLAQVVGDVPKKLDAAGRVDLT